MLTATASQIADVTTTPQQQPGLRVRVPNNGADQTLYWVDVTSGNVTIKDAQRTPASTDRAVVHPASSGDQEWVYVYNSTGGAISRGQQVAHDVDGSSNPLAAYNVRVAPTNCPVAQVVGVAQHTIPAGRYGYVLRSGVGKALVTATALNTGVAIAPSATAGSAAGVAATAASIGFALAGNGSAAGLIDARLNCVG